jgi:ABC-type polysaccharide/polyol phosphate export permease
MMVYYVIFGIVFKAKEEFFVPFLFIGQTMWAFFNKNVVQSVKMIKRNKSIVSKVYLPKFVLLFTNMMVNGFKMMISWIIVLIMMVFFGVPFTAKIVWFIPIMLVLFIVTFAVCTVLMHFGVFIEDLGNVINIVMQLLFYMTGIFYNLQTRLGPEYPRTARFFTYANPVALLLRDMRNVLLYNVDPSFKGMALWTVIALVVSAIGVHTIYKYENSYVKVI